MFKSSSVSPFNKNAHFACKAFNTSIESKIELLEATKEDSAIAKFIAKKGEGIHHIAFAVDNVNAALSEAKSNRIRLIDAKARKGAEGLSIAFLNPKSTFGVFTELCSPNIDSNEI